MASDKISVAILTKNAGRKLKETLTSIYEQKIDGGCEIVVVDSGSSDETLDILRTFDARVYKIKPEEFNFGLTRNYAFSLASGDFIITVSQDAVPCNASWINNMIAPFYGNEKIAAVQGDTKIIENSDVFYWEKIGLFYFTSETKKWLNKYKYGLSFVNCAIRREFWENNQIGFALHSEDKVFQKMIHDSGKEVFYAKEAVCYHMHCYSLKSLIRRLTNEGVGWQHVGVHYGIMDCLHDLYENKWMLRKSVSAFLDKDVKTIQEIIFPILRPLCIYLGNRKKMLKGRRLL